MKWKAIEPKEGDFITDVPDNMIAWAKKNNITVKIPLKLLETETVKF